MKKKYTLLNVILLLYSMSVFSNKSILTVYTYNSSFINSELGKIIKSSFENKYHCKIKLISLDHGITLLNRLRMEGKNSPADIVIGLDNNLIDLANKTGLFIKSDININKLILPIKWNNNIFIPYDYGYFSFIYNNKYITKIPKNFDEFLDSTQNWKIIYQDPRISTPGLALLLWIQKIYGDNSFKVWKKIARKTVTITKGWSEAYGLFLKGESDFVFSYTSSIGLNLFNKKKHYKTILFNEGHYIQIEVMAQLANSKHPKLAQQFIKFILSPTIQKQIPIINWMYPVINVSLPDFYKKIPVPKKTFQLDAKEITRNRAKWIILWQNAVSD